MITTYGEALNIVGERTWQNYSDNRRDMLQRRNVTVDLYGIEYTRDADGGSPATFYLSYSPDYTYMNAYRFKIIILPFTSTVSGGTQSATVTVDSTELTASESGNEITIRPNPHRHTTEPHTHNVVKGITLVNTTASDFRVKLAGVDITAYLMAQIGGEWIEGEGVYPAIGTDDEDFFDIVQVASDMAEEGDIETANKLLTPGQKKLEISSASPFRCTLSLYPKYNHVGR